MYFVSLFGGGEDILAKKQATEGRLFFIVKVMFFETSEGIKHVRSLYSTVDRRAN